jgi:hypothetical protein
MLTVFSDTLPNAGLMNHDIFGQKCPPTSPLTTKTACWIKPVELINPKNNHGLNPVPCVG